MEWRKLDLADGKYEASTAGTIRRVGSEKELKPISSPRSRYDRVSIGGKKYYIHKLVYHAFNPFEDEELKIRHKDRNNHNNSLRNLEPKHVEEIDYDLFF